MKCISAPAIVAFLLSSAILSAAQPVPVLRTQERTAHPVERPHGASPDGALALRTLTSDSNALSARGISFAAAMAVMKESATALGEVTDKHFGLLLSGTAAASFWKGLRSRDVLQPDHNDARRSMMDASGPRSTSASDLTKRGGLWDLVNAATIVYALGTVMGKVTKKIL
ncbi:unnamed protein product [Tilletia controversa]|nr:unnamed protein product [Tilletia caries]CAD6897909.1 unnamed protein product [Tilletia caries]CAD6935630.1 unnamed protein product [Tilletia controversa]CAD6942264.1 unnamed protein product [Tilletia laevis]CAD7062004.1 unnamed protein product [Tilletia caries]